MEILLFANGNNTKNATLDESNNWTFTFYNLDKYFNGTEIVYRINETEVVNYTTVIVNDGYNWNVTNNHTKELVNVTVLKVWDDNDNQDGFRPPSVEILLFANGNNTKNATFR